ncbi:MAG: hypothetical protein HY000_32025 [Planctomycetes bacterium]|nr:hypothetical protein [Planctomycetota bacterium]
MGLKSTFGAAVPLPPPSAVPTAPHILPVSVVFQEETRWCWAACCEMLFKYFNFSNDSKCQIASNVFSQSCCTNPASCNLGQLASHVFWHFSFPFQPKDDDLAESEVHDEIAADRPVEVLWRWNGGFDAHLVLIIGVYPTGDLEIIDPREYYGQNRFSYEAVQDADGLGEWIYSYFELNQV